MQIYLSHFIQVLHPGSCKQSVPPALAIFDESTIAAILSYFPKRQDAAGFLQVFSNWWIVSNSKQKIHGRNRRSAGDKTIWICSNSSFSKRSLRETLRPISADERWQILGVSSWSTIIWKDTKIEVLDKSRLWFRWCPKWWLIQSSDIN